MLLNFLHHWIVIMKNEIKKSKVIIHYCQQCDHEWYEKLESSECPECHSFFLDIEKKF